MKRYCMLGLILCLLSAAAAAETVPANSLDELLDRVRQLRTAEQGLLQEREHRFLLERDNQKARLDEAQARLAAERERSDALRTRFNENEQRIADLRGRLRERAGTLAELAGTYRQVWGDAEALLSNSLISAQLPERIDRLDSIRLRTELPSITQLEGLWLALQEEMTETGKVVRFSAPVIAADGSAAQRKVTRIGPFSAVSEGRFLRYDPEQGLLRQPARQPAGRYRRAAAALERAGSGVVPAAIDPSRGVVLDLLVQRPSPGERIRQGRVIGYLILALALVGALLVVHRAVHLQVIDRRVRRQIQTGQPDPGNPLGRVLAVYQQNRGLDLETLERKIDEAIIRDTPQLQRGLTTIRILAVIAPMLGLLGTVTGLIETFQSITLFGTGDPRLMAGGISQALITTALGLGAAIPLILFHAGLNNKSKRLLGILEEQSAGLIAAHAEKERRHAVAS
jgi:biopolymer transport protein ExbB